MAKNNQLKVDNKLATVPKAIASGVDELGNTAVGTAFGEPLDLTNLAGSYLADEAADGADYCAKQIQSQKSDAIGKTSAPVRVSSRQPLQTAATFIPENAANDDGIADLYTAYQDGLTNDINEIAKTNFVTAQSAYHTEVENNRVVRAQRMQQAQTRNSSSPGFFARTGRDILNAGKFAYGFEIGAAEETGNIVYSAGEALDHPIRTAFAMYAAGQQLSHAGMHFMRELWNAQTRPEVWAQLKDGIGSAGIALSTKYKELSELTPKALGEAMGSGAVDAASYLVPGGGEVKGAELVGNFDRGVTFFSKSKLHYFAPDAFEGTTNLGAPGKPLFFMPIEDAAKINSSVRAAIETGFAPSVYHAWQNGTDIHALSFPLAGIPYRFPTLEDAMGNINFRPGGNTAIRAAETNLHLVNSTRERVITGGIPMPLGSVVFRLGDQGEWMPLWRFK